MIENEIQKQNVIKCNLVQKQNGSTKPTIKNAKWSTKAKGKPRPRKTRATKTESKGKHGQQKTQVMTPCCLHEKCIWLF